MLKCIRSSLVSQLATMSIGRQSDCFHLNFLFWEIFGIWPGKRSSHYYKYYSAFYLLVTLLIYNVLLTLNLIYTPRKIELLIREVIFYFTEVAVTSKVIMIIMMRNKILEAFDLLDCEIFKGDDDVGKQIVNKNIQHYKTYWKLYAILSNFAYGSQVVIPIFVCLLFGTNLELPIGQYYFLSDEVRNDYFTFWFFYQSFGMYGHMMYNVNIDSFIAGLILMAITQLKVINHKLTNMKSESKISEVKRTQEDFEIMKLHQCLKHYDHLLKYCSSVQEIINVTMFVQFGMASAIICTVMCGLLLPLSTEALVFMISYLFAMTCQIFVPGWLGTQLSFESQELVFAAYNCEWIPRSERFKRSIRLLVQRANTPIVLKGLKMFPLSLGTFTSIMKTAYSFFALVRNLQNNQNQKDV